MQQTTCTPIDNTFIIYTIDNYDHQSLKHKLPYAISAGHILRLPPDRLASVAMESVADGGKRRRHPSKTWRQTLKKDLLEMRVSWSGVHTVASVWSWWKRLVAQHSSRSGRI